MAKTKGSLKIQLDTIIDDYADDVKDITDKAIRTVAAESALKLRNTSPKRTGEYARSWDVKKQKELGGITTAIVYNKDHYRLTHLLENGHVVKNAKGTYGRTRGIKHIKPVEEWGANELVATIERELK